MATNAKGWWTSPDQNPEGVRIRVGATHRKLPAFLNALLDVGLEASASSSRHLSPARSDHPSLPPPGAERTTVTR
jgi:hypothetical protein